MNCEYCSRPLGWPGIDWTPLICPNCNELLPDLEPPEGVPDIPGYEVLGFVGEGGMGEVLLARNLGLDRLEAIKIIVWTNQKPSVAMRFQREAQVSGQLKHPAIVPVYSMRSTDECIYYTMPYIPGPSLHQAIGWAASSEDAPALWRLLVSPDSAGVESSESASNLAPFQGGDMYVFRMLCERFAELADGLHTAHGMGVVHRDIKPANILVAPNGTLRLMDFGLAFVRDEVSLTHTGQVLGTPQFMSPEQIMSHVMRIDHRSDVYSLGASMYAAFTLRPPFDIEEHDIPGLLRRITTMMPPRPGGQRSRFPVDLEGILLHCLEKDSSNRYSTAKDLALDLRRFLHFEPIQARNVRLRTRFSLFFKRHQQTVRATSVAAALLFVGLAFLNLFSWVRSREDMTYARRLIAEAESFTDEGVAMYRWSRAHADAGKNVEARMWAEEGDREMDQAIARLDEARERHPGLVTRGERAEPQVRKFLHQASIGLMNNNVGGAAIALESAERLAGGTPRLEVLCREIRSLSELFFEAFPSIQEAYLLGEEADEAAGRFDLSLGVNPLPAPGNWTLVVTDRTHGRLEAPVVVLPPGGKPQRIVVPVSPSEVERSYPGMALVPGGFARLGYLWTHRRDGRYGERLAYIRPFLVSRHEVTNREYLEFRNSSYFEESIERAKDEYKAFAAAANRNPLYPSAWEDELPEPDEFEFCVRGISFVEAVAYAGWKARQSPGTRLPTEGEWEKVARGPSGPAYPWGDHFGREQSYAFLERKPVGMRELDRSPYGVYDVVGGAPEWTSTLIEQDTQDELWSELSDRLVTEVEQQEEVALALAQAGAVDGASLVLPVRGVPYGPRGPGNVAISQISLADSPSAAMLRWAEEMSRPHVIIKGWEGVDEGSAARHLSRDGAGSASRGVGGVGLRLVRDLPGATP